MKTLFKAALITVCVAVIAGCAGSGKTRLKASYVNIGTVTNDNTGDLIRTAFAKVNTNAALLDTNIYYVNLLSNKVDAASNRMVAADSYLTGQVLVAYANLNALSNAPAGGSNTTANTATGLPGMMRWDTNYFYLCTGTNVWRRISLSSY